MTTNTKQNIPDYPSRHKVSTLPWTADDGQVISDDTWIADCTVSIATSSKTDRLNAQFIVAACNQHAALLAVAEAARNFINILGYSSDDVRDEKDALRAALQTLNSLPTPK